MSENQSSIGQKHGTKKKSQVYMTSDEVSLFNFIRSKENIDSDKVTHLRYIT